MIFLRSLEKFISDYNNSEEFDYDFFVQSFETYKLIDLAINELVSKNIKYKSIPPWNLIDQNSINLNSDDKIYNNIVKLKILKKIKNKTDHAKEIVLRSCSEKIYFIDELLSGRVCGWEVYLKFCHLRNYFLGKGFLPTKFIFLQ